MKTSNIAGVLVLTILSTACYGPPRVNTTYLQSVDLIEMTDLMAQSFATDGVIAARDGDDASWIISIDRVVNHTNEVIPDREKWLYVARMRALLAQSAIGDQRGIVWVVPPERWPLVGDEYPDATDPRFRRLRPTHVLSATFNSLSLTSGAGRTDTYLCSFQLMSLDDGRLIWEDSWEVKRSVRGVTYD